MELNQSLYTFDSEPTHAKDPVDGFKPIRKDQVHFLDVTNDGLKLGVNPNQKANRLWDEIERQIQQINADARKSGHEEL